MKSEAGGRSRLAVISALGVVQILAWGSSFYLPAVRGAPIADATGWPLTWVVGGLALGLLVAAVASPHVGTAIQRHGGRPVLALAALLLAAGLATLGLAPILPVYLAGWLLLGLGMGCGLYDPAFATLGRLYGATARPAIRGRCKKVTSASAKAEQRANSGRGFGSEAGQGLVESGLADLHAGGSLAHGETCSEKSPGSDELVRCDHGLSASLAPAGFRGA